VHLFVIGAGPVGLTTAVGFAQLGHDVTVNDIDRARLASIRAGRAPFFEPGMETALAGVVEIGRLRVKGDAVPPPGAEVTIVCVPTPTGADGILSMAVVLDVVERVVAATGPDHTIAIRSTMPLDGPDRLAELVSRRENRPAIVVNPEFMREGNALADFATPDRVVVGWLDQADERAAERVAELYAPLAAPTLVADARSTALLKLSTNVFLAMKIGFANELARLADALGADIGVVTHGLGLDPRIGRAFLGPGPGIGGSCLPEQAEAIGREAALRGVPAELLSAVGRVNRTHQAAIIDRLRTLLDGLEGRDVALFGLAFKAGTDDVRESPALALAMLLRENGARVVGHDPRAVENAGRADPDLVASDNLDRVVEGADAAVIVTEWPEYGDLDWAALGGRMRGNLVFDTRGVGDAAAVAAAGLRYVALGGARAPARDLASR
jgi:UDPglucose 6-dehydrogenase